MTTWNIAVCDDEQDEREEVLRLINRYNEELIPLSFSSAKELLRAAENTKFDLILLDIEMTAPTGFEAAKQIIATQEPRPLIVFITKSNAYTTKGYGVAFRYLVKPVPWDDFVITMDAVVDELTANRFSFELNGKLHSLPLQSIYFIESFAHIAVIHTADEEYRIRATLSELKQTLPMSRFATPHKSYLVNMAYINSVAAEDIILTNGVRIPISRRRKQDFNKDFCRFLGR